MVERALPKFDKDGSAAKELDFPETENTLRCDDNQYGPRFHAGPIDLSYLKFITLYHAETAKNIFDYPILQT